MNIIFFSIIDVIKSYYNEYFPAIENGFDSNFLIEGWINLQKSIEEFSGTDVDIA